MELDHERAINMYTKIVLVNDKGDRVEAFVRDNFPFANTSRYQSMFDLEVLNSLSNGLNALEQAGTMATGANIAQRSLKSMNQSMASWTGTDKPSFNFNLIFVATKAEDDPMAEVFKLLKGIYPTADVGSFIMKAPLDYNPNGMAGAFGTWTVSIGTWFLATYQILTSVNVTVSKEVVQGGKPLFVDAAITFEPYRMITFAEFKQYFKQPLVEGENGDVFAQANPNDTTFGQRTGLGQGLTDVTQKFGELGRVLGGGGGK